MSDTYDPSTSTGSSQPAWLTQFGSQIASAAQTYGVPPSLLAGLIQTESGGNPRAMGAAGEIGLTQILPQNDAALGITNPLDPTQQINGAAKLLAQDYANTGSWFAALQEYNGGGNYASIPATATYANKVLNAATSLGGDFSSNMANPSSSGSATAAANPGATDFIGEVEGFFVRFGLIIAGGIIIVVALWQLLSNTGAVPSPAETAKAATKAVAAAA